LAIRPGDGRPGAVRSSRARAAAAAADDRPQGQPTRGRQLLGSAGTVVVGRPDVEGEVRQGMIRGLVRWVDERSGAAPFVRKTLRYLFPDHWSFLLGEVALYCFVVLVATGIYLTLFFEPSLAKTTYHGAYEPLRGVEMSEAYRSTVNISLEVK